MACERKGNGMAQEVLDKRRGQFGHNIKVLFQASALSQVHKQLL